MEIPIPIKHKALYITILCFLLFSSACSSTSSVIPATGTAAYTATYTPQAVSTRPQTFTPIPSATPTPLVTDLGQVIFSENFDGLDFPFNVYGPKRVDLGVLVLDEAAADQPSNGIYAPFSVPPGATTVVLFKTTGGAHFNIGYHTGDYGTESLRRFSFNSSQGVWDFYVGNSDSKGEGNYPIENWNASQTHFDRWNYFSLTRSANGDMTAKLWERDNPESMFKFQGNLGPEWGALELTFFVDFRSGSFLLDEYQDIQ